jgi:hypothetical protein
MVACSATSKPFGSAFVQWVGRAMEVILHIGAHGTGTKDIRDYMRRHAEFLASRRTGFVTSCVSHAQSAPAEFADANDGDLHEKLAKVRKNEFDRLIVSDDDLIGTLLDNIATGALYATADRRLRNFLQISDKQVATVLISTRSLDLYWCAALAHGVAQGAQVPHRDRLRALAHAWRGWREVITDMAAALPNASVRVLPFEEYAGRPHQFLADGLEIETVAEVPRMAGTATPALPELRRVVNARGLSQAVLPFGMGPWNPFTNEEHAVLREKYADDRMWLTAGADGLATLIEDRCRDRAGQTLPPAADRKGRTDDIAERKMARPR